MAKNQNTIKYGQLVSKAIGVVSNQRAKEIIKQRFGLEDGERKTLERIGQKYGITRERVRQIEEAAFVALKKSDSFNLFKPAFSALDNFFIQEGQLAREERLLSSLTNQENPHPERGAVFFILTIGQPYERFIGTDQFYTSWANSKNILTKAERLINFLIKDIERKKQVVPIDYILEISKKAAPDLSQKALFSYIDVSKQIDQNSFGQYGLSHWPEINPRGVKDKTYLVFKKENRPLHFREVAELINQNNFDSRLAHPQTVHNELIKDSRFVLVGRGTYALTEWGYQSGTVQDIIKEILKENSSLTKDEIVKEVLKNRLVKENTVLINLQNRKYFIRDEEGKYSLKKF